MWFKNPIEKAIDVVGSVADKGMSIWDKSEMTNQESSELFLKLLNATKSQATSISRRHLLWFIIAMTGLTAVLAVFYNHFGMKTELDGLVRIIEVWKIGYAFTGAIMFYLFAHITGAVSKGDK